MLLPILGSVRVKKIQVPHFLCKALLQTVGSLGIISSFDYSLALRKNQK